MSERDNMLRHTFSAHCTLHTLQYMLNIANISKYYYQY